MPEELRWDLDEYVGTRDPQVEFNFDIAVTRAFDAIAVQPASSPVASPSSANFSNATNPLTCPTCGKKYSTRFNLRQHQTVHSGEKPHVCTVCRKAFSQTSHLKVHMRTHFDEKTYSCTYGGCGEKFKRKDHRDRHAWTHEPKLSCTVAGCSAQLSGPVNLKRHIKRSHPSRQT
ncbi:Zinc finger, C2H2 type [compost metagenome]